MALTKSNEPQSGTSNKYLIVYYWQQYPHEYKLQLKLKLVFFSNVLLGTETLSWILMKCNYNNEKQFLFYFLYSDNLSNFQYVIYFI